MNNISIYINEKEIIRFDGYMNLAKGTVVYFLGERYEIVKIESKRHTINVYLEHSFYNKSTINFNGAETATIKHGTIGKEKLNPFESYIPVDRCGGIGVPSKKMGFGVR